jgi:hypothetical protein
LSSASFILAQPGTTKRTGAINCGRTLILLRALLRNMVQDIEKKDAFVTGELAEWLHISEFIDFANE